MKTRTRRTVLTLAGLALLLVAAAAFLLPRLADVESYRGLLKTHLEGQLGRPVEFGAMELSLWPVLGLRLDDLAIGRTPEERFDAPVTAQSLRVGARLFPLLGGRLQVTSLVVEGPVLTLYRRDDGSFEPVLTSSSAAADEAIEEKPGAGGSPLIIERLRVRGGRVVLRQEVAGELREASLDDLGLHLDGLGSRGPLSFELTAGLGGSATFQGKGTLQPGDDAESRPLGLSAEVELTELAPETLRAWLAALAPTLDLPQDLVSDRPFSSRASVNYTGSLPARLEVSDAVVDGLGLHLVRSATGVWNYESLAAAEDAPAGRPESEATTFHLSSLNLEDTSVRIEDRSAPGGPAVIEFAPLNVKLRQPRPDAPIEFDLDTRLGPSGSALALRGTLETASDPPRIDLELSPARLAAADLAGLAAVLAPEAGLSFSSTVPVGLELRVRGPLGGETLPVVEGRATLSGFAFRVAGMSRPMEQVGASVTFSSDRLALENFEGVIGKSDVTASRVVLTNFSAPRVELELNSRNADFWELFSFMEATEPSSDPSAPPVAGDPLAGMTIEGTLRIEQGSLQTLAFQKMVTGIDLRQGILTLEPLQMDLYGGHYSGKVVQDLNTGILTVGGNGRDVDADGFLGQNLALGGLLAGRATTELNLRVGQGDPANVLSGVSGGGPLRLIDGRLAKLDVLQSLSKVTGIFGERSLGRLTQQLGAVGTPFRRAETRLDFDRGTLALEDLVLETAELTLAGRAALNSATGELDGRFVLAFSPELSATMREEQSRAASLFWDPKSRQVSFGFEVGGLAGAPRVSVDWDGAVRGLAERKLGEKLQGLLADKLGVAGGGVASKPLPGAAEPAASGETAAPGADEPSEPAVGTAPGLAAAITRTRWTGPVLLRDLAIEGNVRGSDLDRAALAVVDARGIEVQRIERLGPLDDQLAALEDRSTETTLSWTTKIDGKRLLAARFPVQVTVTVYDRQGASASTTREVER